MRLWACSYKELCLIAKLAGRYVHLHTACMYSTVSTVYKVRCSEKVAIFWSIANNTCVPVLLNNASHVLCLSTTGNGKNDKKYVLVAENSINYCVDLSFGQYGSMHVCMKT